MDATAIGILLGLGIAALYVAARLHRRRDFDLIQTVLVSLAGFTLPIGVGLIAAGIQGTPESLPSGWRPQVVVAGIVALGLAGQFTVSQLREATQKAKGTVDAKRREDGG